MSGIQSQLARRRSLLQSQAVRVAEARDYGEDGSEEVWSSASEGLHSRWPGST